jgi:CheY-like chemotaxis protein
MKTKLNCILLIDDDYVDNLCHKKVIQKMDIAHSIKIAKDGEEALRLLIELKDTPPELIFLDINMPRMNGWEFLEAYRELNISPQKSNIILMLSTSQNPDDKEKAGKIPHISGFNSKPLSEKMLSDIMEEYF